VKIRVQEKETFLPGMSVTAEVETRSRTNVVTIPIQCVTTRLPNDMKGKTNRVDTASKGAPSSDGDHKYGEHKKQDEASKPIEVVFVMDGDHVKMVPVKRGISDDNYVEITEGLKEGAEVITGPYKALSHDLEDGTKVLAGTAKVESKKN
jgi:HlyD family secretion protein